MNKIIIGIYKIISPTEKIYIGQAINIYERWSYYKCMDCKRQRILYRSLKKHGVHNHKFEIVHILEKAELTRKEIISELNKLETYYIKEFNSFVDDNPEFGMNLTRGGGSKETSKETKIKQSESKKREKNPMFGKRISDEAIKRGAEKRKGMKKNPESVKKGAEKRRGLKRSDEFRDKISKIMSGRKQDPEIVKKRIQKAVETRNNKSQEEKEATRKKQSKAMSGRKKHPDAVKKSSDSKRGKKQSKETCMKKSIAMSGENNPMFGKKGELSPNFGKKLTSQHIEKISGDNHWTKYKEIPEETRQKQREAKLNKKQSPEHIARRIKNVKLTWLKKRKKLQ